MKNKGGFKMHESNDELDDIQPRDKPVDEVEDRKKPKRNQSREIAIMTELYKKENPYDYWVS
jgi:hypothetical protein